MKGYELRLAIPSDLPHVQAVERAATELFRIFPEVYERYIAHTTPEHALLRGIEAQQLWVATFEGIPVGFALAFPTEHSMHLDELDVDPAHGRKGLGAALIEAVCTCGRQLGLPACTLVTMDHVPWNAPYYRKLGFRELSWDELPPPMRAIREREMASGQREHRVVMRKSLAL